MALRLREIEVILPDLSLPQARDFLAFTFAHHSSVNFSTSLGGKWRSNRWLAPLRGMWLY